MSKRIKRDTIVKTGGTCGADYYWAEAALRCRCRVLVESFKKHSVFVPRGVFVETLNDEILKGNAELIQKTARKLKRNMPASEYTFNLLSRNMEIVKGVEAVYAVGFLKNAKIEGGTAWGCAAFEGPVYFYDQTSKAWFCDSVQIDKVPSPLSYERVACIGSRELTEDGIAEIKKVFDKD